MVGVNITLKSLYVGIRAGIIAFELVFAVYGFISIINIFILSGFLIFPLSLCHIKYGLLSAYLFISFSGLLLTVRFNGLYIQIFQWLSIIIFPIIMYIVFSEIIDSMTFHSEPASCW